MNTEVVQADEIWDLLNNDLPEEEILAQLANHLDQEAIAAVTGGILSWIIPVSTNTQPLSD